MKEFYRNNILNIILSAINVAYLVIGSCIWIVYFSVVKKLLEESGSDAGLGGTGMVIMFLYLLIAISFVLFVPLAIVTRSRSNISQRFYKINTASYIYITVANIATILLSEEIVDKIRDLVI